MLLTTEPSVQLHFPEVLCFNIYNPFWVHAVCSPRRNSEAELNACCSVSGSLFFSVHLVFLSSVQWDSQTRKALRVPKERGGRKISVYVHPVCIYIYAYTYIHCKDLTCIPSPFTAFFSPCPHPSLLLFPSLTTLLPYNIKQCQMRSLSALPTDRPGDSLQASGPGVNKSITFRKWTRQPPWS